MVSTASTSTSYQHEYLQPLLQITTKESSVLGARSRARITSLGAEDFWHFEKVALPIGRTIKNGKMIAKGLQLI